MTEQENTTSVSAPVEEQMDSKDVEILSALKRQIEMSRLNLEKSSLQLQLLESNLQNLYFKLTIKYKLDPTKDGIEDNGRIIRRQTTTS